jgi:signal transduction histidine kinase
MGTPDDDRGGRRPRAWRPPSPREFELLDVGRHDVVDQLHDDALQSIIAARIRLEHAHDSNDPAVLHEHLDFIGRRLDYALRAVRSMGIGPVPAGPPTETVVEAVSAAVDAARDEFDLKVTATCSGRARQPTSAAPVIHHIVLEALRNVGRHARTGTATIDASVGDEIHVSIQDLGCGFARETHLEDASSWPLGPGGLRRAADAALVAGGQLSIDSSPSSGTSLRLRLPFARRER